MAKSWDEMSPLEKDRNSKEYAKMYGVDYDSFQPEDTGSQENFRQKDFDEALSRAANNHYDTRRSIEAAKQAGYEGASDLAKGISNMDEFTNAHNFLKDYHKAELGGNKFSSRNDMANVTSSFVDMDRDRQNTMLEESFQDYSDVNSQQTEQPTTELPPRDEFEDTDAYQYFQTFQRDANDVDIFGNGKDQPTAEGDQGEITVEGMADHQRNKAALNFANNYKVDLIDSFNLKPQIS